MSATRSCCNGTDPECSGASDCAARAWAEVERLRGINHEMADSHNAMNLAYVRLQDELTDARSAAAFARAAGLSDGTNS